MKIGKTAAYYQSHPEARKKKQAYDIKFNKSKSATAKRVALNAYNRKNHDPKGNGTDAFHKGNRIAGYKSASANRASKSDSAGDRRARGGGKRK